jgi:hypothetical protein
LVIVRDVVQHLPLREGVLLLRKAAGIGRWLLASTYVGGVNEDISVGDCYAPDLTARPFGLHAPDRMIFDGHHYHQHDTDQVRDARKHLGLWRTR